MEMFEFAARNKLRFDTPRGALSVEDLWDLPVHSGRGVSLDSIAIELRKQIRDGQDDSFFKPKTEANSILQLRMDLVKYIGEAKQKEADAARAKIEKAEKKKELMSLLADKQRAELMGKSAEDIQKMIDAL